MSSQEGPVHEFEGLVTSQSSQVDPSSSETVVERDFYDRDLRHDRYLDSIIEQTLDQLVGHSDDVMALAEIDFYKKRDVPDTDYSMPYNRAKEWIPETDVDLAVIDFENKVIGAYEVKPNPDESEEAWGQLEDFRDHVEKLNDEHGMDWRVTGQVINERHLRDEYGRPESYDQGVYHRRGLERGREDDDFRVLEENLFRGLEDEEVFRDW